MFKKLFQKPREIEPNFYENGSEFVGVFPLVESDEKVSFPKYPERKYQVDGNPIEEFRLLVMSEIKDLVIADIAFRDGLEKLSSKVQKETADSIIVSALTTDDLLALFS
ncbi:hypothetical protein [Streptococcus cuniculi]|uniref:DUF4299 family protein n=1 Tax=Streptococcus cuniculi TaxID=1432788 RepID=A0A4Y9JC33_9STRE|nr:hypothetical protein [Streptococcus cuniculi]MBF0778741.1 hypothetical protein [Streptococcus cuniculi]TFU97375.1 hypothetical protein E4T82_08425 [Streptococcus cuniculi]